MANACPRLFLVDGSSSIFRAFFAIPALTKAVHNIRGVKGIGKKTAVVLIQQFHSLENLFARLHETAQSNLRGVARIRKILEDGREQAFLSRQLATVNGHVPIEVTQADVHARTPEMEKVRALFTELGFSISSKYWNSGSRRKPPCKGE